MTELGIVIFVNFMQLQNADVPIDSTFSPMTTVLRLEHPWNTELLIEVTELGIVIFINEEHKENALFPIFTMPSPIVTVANAEHP